MSRHKHPKALWIGLCSLAIFLIWQVASQSFAAYFADFAPETALLLHPGFPKALINRADQDFEVSPVPSAPGPEPQSFDPQDREPSKANTSEGASQSRINLDSAFSAFEALGQNQSVSRPIAPPNAPAVRRWVETALVREPLNAHALRLLAQLAEARDDDESALNLMETAVRVSLHDGTADMWLLQKGVQAGDNNAAIYYADVILRTNPEWQRYVVPVLAYIVEHKDASRSLTEVLGNNPPWRHAFFENLPSSAGDARTPLGLLMALRSSATPPSSAEVDGYIKFLVLRRFYDLAYYTWLQFLPTNELRNAGFLFNGNFEISPSGAPFNWQITSGAGVTVDIVPRADKNGEHALLVDFQFGRVDYHSVVELVMLAPGTYQFEGKYKGQLVGPRGLKWRAVCADEGAAPLGESPMIIGMTPTWKTTAFSFTVPEKNCRAQYVKLDLDARMASERLLSGSVLFDELQISRMANPS